MGSEESRLFNLGGIIMQHKTKVIIKTNDPKEAEYLAKVLINDAQERKLSVACTKLFNGLFGIEYKKEVKIKGKS